VGKGAHNSAYSRGQNRARAMPTRRATSDDFAHSTAAARPKIRLSELRMAIHQTLNCQPQLPPAVVNIRVSRKGRKPWTGSVYSFEITGHPRATRCYVWPEALDAKTVVVRAVLHSDKISSPERAVNSVLNRKARG
jgi:hypothetical protein